MSVCQDLFGAGAETGSSSVTFCLMYICLHPDVQEKIHQELDEIVGQDCRPTFSDREKYVTCLVFISNMNKALRYNINSCDLKF